MWIKICANTSLDDALLAAEAGADAIGFVFAPSPRRVTAGHVAAITQHLPQAIEKIGVFVDAPFAEILRTVDLCSLSGVQLHGATENNLPTQLRAHFGSSLRILHVVHFHSNAAGQIQRLAQIPAIDAILVDSRTASAVGGTGTTFDWESAQDNLFTKDRTLKLIAAGGLTPLNVAEAIRLLAPWGVDVASGVELSPGKKDPAKIRAFINNARTATQQSAP